MTIYQSMRPSGEPPRRVEAAGSFWQTKQMIMKKYLCPTILGSLLLLASGCQSDRGYARDEAKTVAHITANQVGSALEFGDRQGAAHILSPLDQSSQLNFGIVLDSQKRVFSSYFKPNVASREDAVMATILRLLSNGSAEVSTQEHGLTLAIVPVGVGGQNTGYVIVGRIAS